MTTEPSRPPAGTTPTTPADPAPKPGHVATWLREPLLHFLLLGAVLFGVDALIASRQADPRVIVIDATVDRQAQDVFKAARGRAPNNEELYALRRVWLDNEVLYREGLALQMDQGDAAIKDRVIFKSLSMINAGLKLPPFDEPMLRQWFEKNRIKYDEPARYDFEEAVLVGDSGQAAAVAFAQALNAGAPGDARAGLRVFKGRPQGTIEQSYGSEFMQALAVLQPGPWSALPQRDGWRVIRLQQVHAARPASFEDLRGLVLQDWKDSVMSEQRSAAVQVMAKKYSVRVAASAETPP